MIRLSQAVPALTAGFLLTRREDFARAAAAHLVAWFVTPATRMNPNLQYAQGYPGGPSGRSYGIIDTLHLVEPARAAGFLKDILGPNFAAVQQWFREYLNWMKTSASRPQGARRHQQPRDRLGASGSGVRAPRRGQPHPGRGPQPLRNSPAPAAGGRQRQLPARAHPHQALRLFDFSVRLRHHTRVVARHPLGSAASSGIEPPSSISRARQ